MTISYTKEVSKVRLLGFTRLLGKWRASIYKLLYREILIYCLLYGIISAIYRVVLSDEQKRSFEKLVFYFGTFENVIPVSFILGFYISIIVTRWWDMFLSIPWTDKLSTYIGVFIQGSDESTVLIRRTLIRYLMIAEIHVFQSISPNCKRRFPTMEHLVESGIMTSSELKKFEELKSPHHKYWVPVHWAAVLMGKARQSNLIPDAISLSTMLEELNRYKTQLGMLVSYDWISVPLVYTQVSTIAVYTFFVTSLVSRQFIDAEASQKILGSVSSKHIVDIYFPGFTIFQLFFFMGLLKVAEQMINPFGEDDDDYEVNWLIDRNLQIALLQVDEMYDDNPPIERDRFWGDSDALLPYTKATQRLHTDFTWMGSVANLEINQQDSHFVYMDTIQESESDHEESTHVIQTSGAEDADSSNVSHQYTPPLTRSRRNSDRERPKDRRQSVRRSPHASTEFFSSTRSMAIDSLRSGRQNATSAAHHQQSRRHHPLKKKLIPPLSVDRLDFAGNAIPVRRSKLDLNSPVATTGAFTKCSSHFIRSQINIDTKEDENILVTLPTIPTSQDTAAIIAAAADKLIEETNAKASPTPLQTSRVNLVDDSDRMSTEATLNYHFQDNSDVNKPDVTIDLSNLDIVEPVIPTDDKAAPAILDTQSSIATPHANTETDNNTDYVNAWIQDENNAFSKGDANVLQWTGSEGNLCTEIANQPNLPSDTLTSTEARDTNYPASEGRMEKLSEEEYENNESYIDMEPCMEGTGNADSKGLPFLVPTLPDIKEEPRPDGDVSEQMPEKFVAFEPEVVMMEIPAWCEQSYEEAE